MRALHQYLVLGLVIAIIALGVILALVLRTVDQEQALTASATSAPGMIGMSGMATMALKTFAVPTTEIVPTIAIAATKTEDGWDLHFTTSHFTFAPEHVDGTPVPGEGHIHLYVDGKLSVVLGNWYHVDAPPAGTHQIVAMLANNDHTIYAVHGAYIEASTTISEP